MIGDIMGYRDQRDLETCFNDPDLKAHFRKAHSTYVKWRDDGCQNKINLIGGGEYKLSTKDTVLYLSGMIVDYDDSLRGMMTGTNMPKEIGLDHDRVAELFALHVTANLPLPA